MTKFGPLLVYWIEQRVSVAARADMRVGSHSPARRFLE